MKRTWMGTLLCFAVLFCSLCAGTLFGTAAAEDPLAGWSPAAGKEQVQKESTRCIVYNREYTYDGEYLDCRSEEITDARITMLSGDEAFRNAFRIGRDVEGLTLSYDMENIAQAGEATYQLDYATEHYAVSEKIHATFIDYESIRVEPLAGPLLLNEGEKLRNPGASLFFSVTPEILAGSGGEFSGEETTDQYVMSGSEFTALKPGEYTVWFALNLGDNWVHSDKYPVTIHVRSREEADAAWKPWPPEGKAAGERTGGKTSLSGIYIYGQPEETTGMRWGTDLVSKDRGSDGREPAVRARVTQISGDEAFRNIYYMESRNGSYSLRMDLSQVPKDGEASYRVDLESEHYYSSDEFTVQFLSWKNLAVSLLNDPIECIVGETVEDERSMVPQLFRISPAFDSTQAYFFFNTPEGEDSADTEGYTLSDAGFTAKAEGDYALNLALYLGDNHVKYTFPVTMHAKEWDSTWPPKDKTEASKVTDHHTGNIYDSLNGTYFFGAENGPSGIGLSSFYLSGPDGDEERATEYHATLLSGDESFGKVLADRHGENPGISVNLDQVPQAGAPTFRIDAASEHYYTSVIAQPVLVDAKSVQAELISADVRIPLNEAVQISDLFTYRDFVKTDPQYEYSCDIQTPDGLAEAVTEDYRLTIERTFIARKAGDYSLRLLVYFGHGGLMKEFPITVHASAETAEAAVEGDAPKSARTIREEEEERQREEAARKAEEREFLNSVDGDSQLAETESARLIYRINEDTACILGILPLRTELIIPAALNGTRVTSISYNALKSTNGIAVTSLTIEEGIQCIEDSAFRDMTNLESLTLPDSLQYIGAGAFTNCRELKQIRLPGGMTAEGVSGGAFCGIGTDQLILPDGTDLMAVSLDIYRKYGLDTYAMPITAVKDGYEYILREDGGAILLSGNRYQPILKAPENLGGHPVREIGISAYSYGSASVVVLPEGLEVIAERAFWQCKRLEEIRIPASVKEIGFRAFGGVPAGMPVLPEDVQAAENWYSGPDTTDSTGRWTYQLQPDQTAVITGYTVSSILEFPGEVDGHPVTAIEKNDAPGDPGEVRKIIVPEGVRVIGEHAFISLHSVEEVQLPSTLRSIGAGAFSYVRVKKVNLPEGLQTIGARAFAEHEISSLILPASLESVGFEAFKGGLVYPSALTVNGAKTKLGAAVFGHQYGNGAKNTNPDLFHGYYETETDSRIQEMNITCYRGSTADLLYRYNVKKQYLRLGPEAVRTAPAGRVLRAGTFDPDEIIADLTIPEGVEEIGDGALANMVMLTRITLPSTLKSVGANAFANCSSLTEITLPKGVTSIGEGCFKGCFGLTKASLPEGIAEIPDHAFEDCASLTGVNLPKAGLRRIGLSAFQGCCALGKLNLGKGLEEMDELAFAMTGLQSAKIPDTVTKIGRAAFAGSAITSLTLPKNLEEIPEAMCYGASGLKSLTIPKGVRRIGTRAFSGCMLNTLNLQEGLEEIGEEAFMLDLQGVQYSYMDSNGRQSYGALKNLKLPASLRVIGKRAFGAQDALASVTFAGNAQLEEIGEDAFAWALRLKELKLPDSVKKIGAHAFVNCLALKTVHLGGGLTELGEYAFRYDEALTRLTVPDTLTLIGDNILEGHGGNLTVICGESSAMDAWLKQNEPLIPISYSGRK